MKSKIKKISKKPFVRNVIVMATGTVAAQFVNLFLQPIITRMYGPEAYGLMGVFIAIVALVGPIAALTYPIAIVLPKSDIVAKGLIRLSLYITTVIALVVGLILLFFNHLIVNLFQLNNIAPFLYLVPLVILFAGFLQVTEQWLIRTKQFRITAKVKFYHAILVNGSKVGIGLLHPVATVLIIITAIGSGVKALMMIAYVKKANYPTRNETDDNQISIAELFKKHRDFPLFRAPQVLLNEASQSLPILMLTLFFGPASAGFYTICRSVISVPSALIGKSVGDVFYPRIAEASKNKENLTLLIKKATIGLGMLGIIPYGVIILFGPWLFSFVFGSDWGMAGEYARWLALAGFFSFLNKPGIRALPVLNAQAFHLIYTVFVLIIRTIAIVVGYYFFSSDLVAVALFGLSGAVFNTLLMLIVISISKRNDKLNQR
ncbi:lipopolysaccharide biosynthesis protein [Alteribacter natronophilus]|uniref:lipopolysaccharide biosynthesis protein n=1 Tax=Alteribacter natronophilus TaxID=2583810 RepID=UPI00110EA070|nr:oligosaccharide flippase family protein [Alteribacter natronophilus]TMW72248.1 lipopolysaccharide biosynthesis protein [Alteribacter natronophilus]